MDESQASEAAARIEALLDEIEALEDPEAREKAMEAAGALVELYGDVLQRIVGRLDSNG